ncbi:5'-nucleotidase [Flavobacterium sp.]|uniref:5'-nucleotidase n=1 Tax=Flavobacterium sp. TaxID=239 RepID=UPI002B4AB65B|nr:5'-nucleotidase [Flavobacterium sp.]
MVNLKKYNVVLKHFVLFLTFILSVSCAQQKYYVTKIEGKEIGITDKNNEVAAIEDFIKPYREHINKDLNTVLAYAPKTLDKSGQWQTTIGNLMADVTLQKGNFVFNSRQKKNIDICLLNHGGIRSIIPKGNVTARTAFEVMPFENTAIVVALKSEQIIEMANHIISEKKPHPLSGMTFTIDKNSTAKNIVIQGKALENDKTYYVVTSDYLSNGGDKMDFFKKGIASYDLDYKLRNILIDYFKEVDTIPEITDVRITKE